MPDIPRDYPVGSVASLATAQEPEIPRYDHNPSSNRPGLHPGDLEEIARRLYEADYKPHEHRGAAPWDDQDGYVHARFRRMASALSELSAPRGEGEGLKLVPVEPTQEMQAVGGRTIAGSLRGICVSAVDEADALNVWSAMLAASPPSGRAT